jgi:hypothetical protein
VFPCEADVKILLDCFGSYAYLHPQTTISAKLTTNIYNWFEYYNEMAAESVGSLKMAVWRWGLPF